MTEIDRIQRVSMLDNMVKSAKKIPDYTSKLIEVDEVTFDMRINLYSEGRTLCPKMEIFSMEYGGAAFDSDIVVDIFNGIKDRLPIGKPRRLEDPGWGKWLLDVLIMISEQKELLFLI
jgi:hypothetical protein